MRRRRQNRLLSLVLENPALVGVGIDESTALEVGPDGVWRVLGESVAVVFDARKAASRRPAPRPWEPRACAWTCSPAREHLRPEDRHGGAPPAKAFLNRPEAGRPRHTLRVGARPWCRRQTCARLVLSLAVLLVASSIFAEDVTLPAAASIVGGAPFFSDVRAFNTSYGSALDVTARYRCFIPSPCGRRGARDYQFTLAPRESRAFNDIVATTFQAPNTAGGVEFDHSGGGDQLVVTSRLYSTAPEPTVGMFIPGCQQQAHARDRS